MVSSNYTHFYNARLICFYKGLSLHLPLVRGKHLCQTVMCCGREVVLAISRSPQVEKKNMAYQISHFGELLIANTT